VEESVKSFRSEGAALFGVLFAGWLMSVYKFYLKAGSLAANPRQGWQISSIAVMGLP
jgi:hypothetical protein